MEKIMIDLRQLTPAMVGEARPNMGNCHYSAPCIIGALLTKEQRQRLDDWDIQGLGPVPGGSYDVGVLHTSGIIEFPDEDQLEDAIAIQARFDGCEEQAFNEGIDLILAGKSLTN